MMPDISISCICMNHGNFIQEWITKKSIFLRLCIVIAYLYPWSDLEKCMFALFLIDGNCHYLIYKYHFTCLLFWTMYKFTIDKKNI